MEISLNHAPGNADVIAKLEAYLAEAREGSIGALAIATARHAEVGKDDHGVKGSYTGVERLYEPLRKGMETLMKKLEEYGDNVTPPVYADPLPADYFPYNCARGSMNFDFIVALIDAEMRRIREGAPAPLKIHFWFGKDGKTGLHTEGRRQFFDKVMRPALKLIGAVEDKAAIEGVFKEFYLPRDIVAAARAGESVPRFRHPTKTILADNIVTITLRELDEWPHRNSNIPAWLLFAEDLKKAGFYPIFVRDTAKAFDTFDDFDTDPHASTDLLERFALYESAVCNLFVANGPCTLALFGSRPWLTFIETFPDGHRYECNTPKFWREGQGIEISEQFPWCSPLQRIVWAKDDYDNITKAWASLGLKPGDSYGEMEADRETLPPSPRNRMGIQGARPGYPGGSPASNGGAAFP
jgi:hypothetical protein